MMNIPRIVVAGTGSGTGKTSIALGIARTLTGRGLRVKTFKIGPDYLDPTYLSLASGNPCHNLDAWMMGENYVRKLFFEKSSEADISIIEGVMGLYDGCASDNGFGSTAHISQLLHAPIILVAGAHGIAQSFAALVRGYIDFQSDLTFAGIIANFCGSVRHAGIISNNLPAPFLGAIMRGDLPDLPARHLGLISADEIQNADSFINKCADAVERSISLDHMIDRASSLSGAPADFVDFSSSNREIPSRRIRIGIAFDSAFHFYYQDFIDSLEEHECDIVKFSPLRDQKLPSDLDAVIIGGGYPEQHAEELSMNRTILDDIVGFAESGRPLYAECGGMMLLGETLELLSGRQYDMAGLLPIGTRMESRRSALGYINIVLNKSGFLGEESAQFRGHEFHYSAISFKASDSDGWNEAFTVSGPVINSGRRSMGFQKYNVIAGYPHLHLASNAKAMEHFINFIRTGSPADPETTANE